MPPPPDPLDYATLPPVDACGRDLQQQRRLVQENLRTEHGPAAPVHVAGQPVRMVLGYEAALTALRNPLLFSSDPRYWNRREQVADPALLAAIMPRPNAMTADGQVHERRRRVITQALATLEEVHTSADVREMADQLIDRFVAEGRADLIGQYAATLPILVLNRALGVEDAAGWALADATRRIWGTDPAEAAQANRELIAFFAQLIERKRKEDRPGADLASWVAHSTELDEDERVAGLMQLIGAGHDPTTHLLANTLHAMLSTPGLFPAAGLPVEQVLTSMCWEDPPVDSLLCRFALRDFAPGELPGFGDAEIKEGDGLLICFAAAHREMQVFADAAIDRPTGAANNAHLMWGVGSHGCPHGARTMGWTIALAGIEALLSRLHGLRLDPDAASTFRPGPFLSARANLDVVFAPEQPRPAPAPATGPQPAPAPRPAPAPATGPQPAQVPWWRRILGLRT